MNEYNIDLHLYIAVINFSDAGSIYTMHIFLSPVGNAPMFTIPNVVFPVAEYFLEDIIKFTRYWFVLHVHVYVHCISVALLSYM